MNSLKDPAKQQALFGTGFALWLAGKSYSYFTSNDYLSCGLRGKVICITGASSGIGREIADLSFKFGAICILVSRRKDVLEDLTRDLLLKNPTRKSCDISIVAADLSKLDTIPDVARQIISCYYKLDVLVNNAGIAFSGRVVDTLIEVHQQVMNMNYFSQVALTKELLPHLLSQSTQSSIVAMSSLQGKFSLPNRSAYGASKFAVQAFYDALRAEIDDSKVSVCVVSPGYVNTEITKNALTADGQTEPAMLQKVVRAMLKRARLCVQLSEHQVEGRQVEKYGKLESAWGRIDKTYCARRLLQAVVNGEKDVSVGPWYHCIVPHIRVITPDIYFAIMKRKAARAISKL